MATSERCRFVARAIQLRTLHPTCGPALALPPEPPFEQPPPFGLIHHCLVVSASQLAIVAQSDHTVALSWSVEAGQGNGVRDALHYEVIAQVVGTAAEAPVGAYNRGALTTNRTVHASWEAQRSLVGSDLRPCQQPLPTFPANTIVMLMGGSAARTKGHVVPSSPRNLLGYVGQDSPGGGLAGRRFSGGRAGAVAARPGPASS